MINFLSGDTIIALGHKPGAWFKPALKEANAVLAAGGSDAEALAVIARLAPPPPPLQRPLRPAGALTYTLNIEAETPDEIENLEGIKKHMAALMRLPTVKAGTVMPDACVAGHQLGTIPVGGVIATENAIHPGMHSADICCSMAISVFKDQIDGSKILDAGMTLSHFGGGGRPSGQQIRPADDILVGFQGNRFLKPFLSSATEHFGTQGDGNHFFYVGRLASTGQLALVTHHGSRKPGAMLYKAGMEVATRSTKTLSPETPAHNAWIVADSAEGEAYWNALQVIRAWTKGNHFAIHDRVAASLGLNVTDRFWNEHNFVFRRSDGLFYHGKGATPAWADFAADSSGLALVPLNMAQPILVIRGRDAGHGLGFAPHGAGRNLSRSAYMRANADKTAAEMIAEQTAGIDCRFFSGLPDISELPGAYKDADTVRQQIEQFGLADVVDTIEPIGSIMAGDWQQDAPWRIKKAAKRAAAAALDKG
jgi:tRNA-splicing ligase RtcB (3'-phosphate/5'-hydroxy nucleic acid ligase)